MDGRLIAFAVVVGISTLYFAIGVAVRYHSGLRHCPEVLPNYRLWCAILDFFIRVFTCGQRRLCFDSTGRLSGGMSVLPNRPSAVGSARRVHFELLASDADDDYDVHRAMQPAEVVVKY